MLGGHRIGPREPAGFLGIGIAALLMAVMLVGFGGSARSAGTVADGARANDHAHGGHSGSVGAGCGGQLTHLKIATVPVTAVGTIPLATARGIFARHCLTVSMTTVPSSVASEADLVDGSVDIAGTASIPIVNFVSQGAALRVLAPLNGEPTLAQTRSPGWRKAQDLTGVFVAKSSRLTSSLSLQGHTVAVAAVGGVVQVVATWLIKKQGGDPNKVKWIFGSMQTGLAELEAGGVDGAGLSSPFSNSLLARGGRLVSDGDAQFFGVGAPVAMWTTTAKRWASEQRPLAEFRAAITEANAYASTHWKQFVPYAAQFTKIPASIVGTDSFAFSFPTNVTEADLARVARNMIYAGFLRKMPNLSGVVLR